MSPPTNIDREITFDPETKQYIIREKLGSKMYRPPLYMSLDEYRDFEFKRTQKNYWEQLAEKELAEERRRRLFPVIEVNSPTFEKIFGGNTIDINPRGSADITLMGQYNTNENPLFNERQRKQWGFDFDQNINLSMVGKIGENVRLNANFNTQAQFGFENQIRFDYVGKDDDIIKRIEVGNVNMALNSTLIQGSESLFGIKTQLQFGKLMFTGLLSQQRSDQKQITITNGSRESEFSIELDNYEANQHFFLAQYFRDHYNQALAMAPIINSPINITQIEVWMSNRSNSYEDARDVLALMDLGEYNPYYTSIAPGSSQMPSTGIPGELAPNYSNDLLVQLGQQGREPNGQFVSTFFGADGSPNDHYAKLTYARKLVEGRDYTVNRRLGYISLVYPLYQDQVLAVSYRYIANGKEYQVGEFSTDIPVTPSEPKLLYTKLLKNETIKTKTATGDVFPLWKLMMKNIYSLSATNISDNNFFLQVYRTEDETGTERPMLYEGAQTADKSWLQLTGLDRITQNQAAGADGLFDFLPELTIEPQRGKLIFPVVEPLGEDLANQFAPGENALVDKYTFPELYSETQMDAQQKFPNKNRYRLKGRYSSEAGTEFQLGVINPRPGSVKVMAGGMLLQEGTDYTVDYMLGNLRILNPALVMSGQPITVSIEDDTLYGLQQKSLIGGRFDYTVNKNLFLGATVMNLTEKPLSEKVLIGQEPISNTMLGADITYNAPSRWLTRMVDKLPFLSTKEESHISFYGEFAQLIPGHPRGLNTANSTTGTTYIDNFENSVSYIDIKGFQNWQISGTPKIFPESQLNDNLAYGYNRAHLAFYNIDPIFYYNNDLNPRVDSKFLRDHRTRRVTEKEIFPFKEIKTGGDAFLPTLDLAYYPMLRGQYNYTTTGINPDGTLQNPESRWGGMFRKIDQTDFEAQNIEFLEMWMMDPQLTNPGKAGGDIYINLGNISEDILKDGRKSLENGMSPNGDKSNVDQTHWGYVIKNQPVVQAFENSDASRLYQDIGLDGLTNDEERSFHNTFLSQMQGILNPSAFAKLQADPSSDDYVYFRGDHFDRSVGILERYQYYNGTQGNTRTRNQSLEDFGVENSASTLVPDGEDINRDNSMNEVDEYFQYKLSIRPADMLVGQNFIVDEVNSRAEVNGAYMDTKWYKIRIPLDQFESKEGNIQDFKSIRFIRMFMTDFADTAVVRFGKLQFVRGDWRKYNSERDASKVIADPGLGVVGDDGSEFNVANVSIEENGKREPIPYVVPPGINRQVDIAHNNLNVQLNEQSMSLDVKKLRDGYGRAAFKTASHDFRAYGRLEMFIHAEGENLNKGDFRAFIRVGTDDKNNYYEYDMPLAVTPYGTSSPDLIWPEENRMNIRIQLFQDAKLARDNATLSGQPWPLDEPYEHWDGPNRITIVGTPDISKVRYYMIGVRNPLRGSSTSTPNDDGLDLDGEFWFNELRLTDFDDKGGWAATARLDLKLADFANVAISGTRSTIGFGALSQRIGERQRSDNMFFDITTNAELGKFFHPRHGIVIPFYFNYSNQTATPEFNPYAPDIKLDDALRHASPSQRDSILRLAQDYTTRKGFSFNNIRKIKMNNESPLRPWNIENFSVSYAYNEYYHRDFNTATSLQKNYRGLLDYTFSNPSSRFFEPFKKIKSKNLDIIKDFNFNLMPSLINFRMEVNRIYNENTFRDNATSNVLPTYYNKNFNMSRIYGISWDLTKSLRLDFNATNYSIIDEPEGRLDGIKRDTLWSNFWKMGRTTDYNHMMNITYSLPINKIPYLEWVDVTARYGTQFNWKSEPLLSMQNDQIDLGNSILNNRTIQINPTLNFTALYNKFRFIRQNSGRNAKGGKGALVQLLTSIRNVNAAYTRLEGTFLPGYTPHSNILGYDFDAQAPGWGFIFGSQADILTKAANNGWLTGDPMQTNMYTKTYAENFSATANLEPLKGLRINLSSTRVDNYNYSATMEFNPSTGQLESTTPFMTGNYTVSQIAIRTSFKNSDELFRKFEENALLVSQELGRKTGQGETPSFADGFGKTQQDVVVNSFLMTYLGKDITDINLNKQPRAPLPNWRISFSGLSALLGLEDFISSIDLNHSYQSQYIIGGYSSVLRYEEVNNIPTEKDVNGNFLPKNQYNQITLVDRFVPLIGVDMRLQNSMTITTEYRRTRDMNLSLQNSQMAMMAEESIVVGMGYRKANVRLPFGLFEDRKWTNDMNFKVDFSLNDRKTTVYRSDMDQAEVSGGNKNISFSPSLDYTVNQYYNLRIFYNSNAVRPYTSQNYATSYTYFGINLRIMFQ
ncbi:cell surface protein SprA [Parapedobacter sp. SGR-10]|uniref:T9SS outer membrane translocon Sov/SprA n=1 Tax=Parapedobacter sp. SGR-10 TaxID=2710879 RepID=UPI001F11431C|nr:cell surface protein SprA [Parapedobacter sp. SGR-10]